MSLFIHKDALWKGIIEDYPKEFIRYFYAKADSKIIQLKIFIAATIH